MAIPPVYINKISSPINPENKKILIEKIKKRNNKQKTHVNGFLVKNNTILKNITIKKKFVFNKVDIFNVTLSYFQNKYLIKLRILSPA